MPLVFPSALRPALAGALLLLVGLLLACSGAGALAPTAGFPPTPIPTRPAPADTPVGLAVNEPGAMDGYALFKHRQGREIYLIDRRGRLAHSWQFPPGAEGLRARLLENGNLLATLRYEGRPERTMVEMSPAGRLLWQYAHPGQDVDFLQLPNGNVLLLARTLKTNWEAIRAGANPDFVAPSGLWFMRLVEVQPLRPDGGAVVWEWSLWDHLVQDFDPARPNYGVVAEHPERIDLNYNLEALQQDEIRNRQGLDFVASLSYHPGLDQIMLAVRHFSELWIIDHSTTAEEAAGPAGGRGGRGGDLLYRWGNPRAYGMGEAAGQQLFFPFRAQWIPAGRPGAGRALVFNNGVEFAGRQRGYSSVDELALPVEGYGYRRDAGAPYPPDAPVWSFTGLYPGGWYSGDEEWPLRLPNGNTFITHEAHGTLFQITPEGETVWQYVNPVLADGSRLRPGDPMPVRLEHPPSTGLGTLWENAVSSCYWYAPDYPGLRPLNLAAEGRPLELPAR